MTPTPHPTEIREMLEKAAKLMGFDISHEWNEDRKATGIDALVVRKDGKLVNTGWDPSTSAHDSRMLAIQAGIEVRHFKTHVNAESYIGAFASIDYPPNPTTADKLQCELLAVLKCAAAIFDEREKL